ncbi:TonB-dependent receptor plug domain-containing protein [Rhizorhabdus argentea]|uniref:TonB-dependent receptor plug domain-containing protein n=1 Tax=Rhizorhabdus argentea TaxID=1387174 RepID=UPI0030EDBCCB
MPIHFASPKRMTMILKRGLASSIFLLAPTAALAQSVNYAELEQLFDEPVTTSVTGKPQRASEAAASITIITRDDIRRSPAHDIPGLIQAYAGIDVARWTGGQSDVAVRGGVQTFNPRLLVMVNGRQIYLDHYGMTNWAGISVQLEEIQQIEVVRGPNSALFGFNAVSGAINIITINPLQSQQASAIVEGGTAGQVRVSTAAAFKLSNWLGLRLSGGYEKFKELEGADASELASQEPGIVFKPEHKELSGELVARIDDMTGAGLSLDHSDSRRLEFSSALFSSPHHYKFSSLGAHVSHDTGWGMVSVHGFRNWSDIRIPLPSLKTELTFHNRVFVAGGDVLVRSGTSDTLRFSVEYRDNQLKTFPGFPGLTRYKGYAGGAMWEHQLDDFLVLTLAARLDHLTLGQAGADKIPSIFTQADYNRSLTDWSGNGALLFRLSDASSLRLAAASGVQAPSLFSFGEAAVFPIPGLPVPVVLTGNPYIKPARIWSAELGFSRNFAAIDSHLELTAFYNKTDNLIASPTLQQQPSAAPPAYPFFQWTAGNVGSFEAYGLEAALSGRIRRNWHWMVNYSWTGKKQDVPGNANGMFQHGLALATGTPAHKVKAQLSYEHGRLLSTVAARYLSKTEQIVQLNRVPGQPLGLVAVPQSLAVDAKIAFSLTSTVTLSVAGDNLTGAGGAGMSPVPAERRLRASAQVRF